MSSPDNYELVRDKIAEILGVYLTAQGSTVEVYTESSRPWEQLRNGGDLAVVNVTFDGDNDDPAGGDPVQNQKMVGTYHVDVVASAESRDGEPGDRAAALRVQEITRQARRAIMASENTYLQLRGTVWTRRVTSRQMLAAQKISQVYDLIACRLTVQVVYNEKAPQFDPVELEGVDVTIESETGLVIVTAPGNQED